MRALLRRLDHHWFAPASLRDLAIVRIVVVGAQLLFFLPSLEMQLRLAAASPEFYLPLPALKVLMLPFGEWGVRPEPMFLHAVWVAAIVSGICALIGLYTRPSLLGFAATNTLLSAHYLSYGVVHHRQAIMMVALWVLALAPSGAALSVDHLRMRMRLFTRGVPFRPQSTEDDRSEFARWPLRLIQWMLVLVYLSAGLSKLANGGFDWFNGYTLTYYFVQDGLRHHSDFALWMAGFPRLAAVLSIGAVAFELLFALAVLLPRWTWLFVLAGIGLHMGIYLTQRAPFFQFMVLYVVFIEPLRHSFAALAVRFAPARSARTWTILYDGVCVPCIRGVVVLEYLDVRRRLAFVDVVREGRVAAALAPRLNLSQARTALHVVSPTGQVFSGFFALRELARVLPPLWLLLPLTYAPLASRAGPWLYRMLPGSAHEKLSARPQV